MGVQQVKKVIRSDAGKKRQQKINPATGGKLNGVSATDPKATNKYKSVTSNYTRTRDDRGTKVESTTHRASKPYVGSSQRNGSTKTKTKGKKKSTSSGIPSFTEMVHEQRRIRAKRY